MTPFLAVTFSIAAFALVITSLLSEPKQALASLLIMLIGLPAFWLFRRLAESATTTDFKGGQAELAEIPIVSAEK